MAGKYYAVKGGREGDRIYTSWDKAKENIDGVSKVLYKGFKTQEEAEVFLGIREEITKENAPVNSSSMSESDELTAYVDGSFREGYSVYGYGAVLIRNGEVLETLSGAGRREKYLSMRNVAGEILGMIRALDWAIDHGYRKMHVYYDYEGIEKWAKGLWKRNNELTSGYHEYFKERKDRIDVVFHKVKGHSGDKYNEMADRLAVKAVEDA